MEQLMMERRGERSSEQCCRIRDEDNNTSFRNRDELEKVRRAIDMGEENKHLILPPIHHKNHSIGHVETLLHKEGTNRVDEVRTPLGHPRSRLISLLQSQNRDVANSDLMNSRDNKFCNPTSNEEADDTKYEDEIEDQSDVDSTDGFKLKLEIPSKYPSKLF